MKQNLNQLRAKIAQHKYGERWGDDLKIEILEQAQYLYQKHQNWRIVTEVLGLRKYDLANMKKSQAAKSRKASFALAVIEQEEESQITVTSPNGFSLQGLNFEQALKAMEKTALSLSMFQNQGCQRSNIPAD